VFRNPELYDCSATAEQIKEEDLLREQMGVQSLQVRFDEVVGFTYMMHDIS
jgi:hypothetical protein